MLAVTDAARLAANAIVALRSNGDDFGRVRRSLQLLRESRKSLQRADQVLEERIYNRATRDPARRSSCGPACLLPRRQHTRQAIALVFHDQDAHGDSR